MAASESNPPPASGGGMKYAIVGLLLLAGAGVVAYIAFAPSGESEEQEASATPEPKPEKRQRSISQPEFVLPDEDAGQPDAGEPEQPEKRVRYIRRDAWDCSGELEASQALSVINQHRRQVRQCYERRLKMNNTLQGQVQLRLRVERNGSVGAVRVGGSLRDPEVFGCIRRIAGQWSFPAPEGGRCAVVAAPFNFSPKN